jgi:hypothetical protein
MEQMPPERRPSSMYLWSKWENKRVQYSTDVLKDKSVFLLRQGTGTMFVALHKVKVKASTYIPSCIRSRGPKHWIGFGTLILDMAEDRQRMDRVKVGILDVRSGEITEEDLNALVSWIVTDKLDMLTGYFGNFEDMPVFVSDLGRRSNAISFMASYQAVEFWKQAFVHPTFFMFYGFYREISAPEEPDVVPDSLWLGEDLWAEMIPLKCMPQWPHNDAGSPFVRNFGLIKMKKTDFGKWFDGCFQTCLWLGTATPGRGSRARQADKANGKGKDWGKDKGNTKGKVKGKGNDEDKGKGKGTAVAAKAQPKGKGNNKNKGKGNGQC